MIPNMYKIAGELTPFTMHVAARTLATHALSIFGDHSDVMACRQTGFALLCSNSVQEAHDMAAVAHAATLESRIPFLHFFDGFRTSHEVAKIEELTDDDLRALIDERIAAHRQRGLTPDRPVLRGTAQNPDVFFQAREGGKRFYDACPASSSARWRVRRTDRAGATACSTTSATREAERVIVIMGSGAETAHETVEHLDGARREGRRAEGPAVSAVLARARSSPRCPEERPRHRGARSAPRSRARRRSALSRRRPRSPKAQAEGVSPFAPAARHRRPLRPVVEGVHAGDGEGGLRRARRRARRSATSPSASSTT